MTEPVVSYGLKDILDRLERKLDELMGSLVLKADRGDVAHLGERVGTLDGRVTSLEHEREAADRHYQERVSHRRWLIPTLTAFLAALASLAAAYAAFHH